MKKTQEFKQPRAQRNEGMLRVDQQQRSGAQEGTQVFERRNTAKDPSPASRQAPQKPQLVQNGISTGNGLWAHSKEEQLQNFAEKVIDRKTKAFDTKIESSILEALEKECQEIGLKYEKEAALARDRAIEIVTLKQIIDKLNKTANEQMTEIMHLRNSKSTIEQQYESLKDLFNTTKRDYNKLQLDHEEEVEKCKTLSQYYDELKAEHEQKMALHEQRIKNLSERYDELLEENEEITNKLQTKQEIFRRTDDERNKIMKDKQDKTIKESERRVEKMSKLLEENAVMSEKLDESEMLRKKFMEKNQALEKQLKQDAQEKRELEEKISQLKKRANDLNVLKSTGHKVLEEKIAKLLQENETLKKENTLYKRKGKNLQDQQAQALAAEQAEEETEQLEAISAKPQLFGAIDNGRY